MQKVSKIRVSKGEKKMKNYKKIAMLTSRDGGMVEKLIRGGIVGDVYSNKPNKKLEQRCNPTYFNKLSEIPTDYYIYLLCGFMNIVPKSFLDDKICINYHPGTQDYKGLDPQKRMLKDYQEGKLKYAGGFIHFVDEGVDTGELIYQFKEKILPTDDVKSLTERMEIKAVDFLVGSLK